MRFSDLFTRRPRPHASADALRRFLTARGLRLEADAPRALIDASIDFHSAQRFAGLERAPDADMMLFQHGCYDWGEGERFELGLVRQFMERGDNPISQLHLTFTAPPEPSLRALGAGELWSLDCADLAGFRARVLGSPALAAIGGRAAAREIYWNRV